jgi:D-alanine-D-alanine ligase
VNGLTAVLHNSDHTLLEDDPGREAREDVTRVAQAVAEALQRTGHQVRLVPVGEDLSVLSRLKAEGAGVVFNLCESLAADSRGELVVPALLELQGLAYTGSPALSLALALHKNKCKEVLRSRGIPTPGFVQVERLEELASLDLPFPLIVKPSREDGSVGIDFDSVVHTRPGLTRAVARVLRSFQQPALVERYIEGREVYVPILGNRGRRALPLTEIAFGPAFDGRPRVLSYRAKWDESAPECQQSASVAAVLSPEVERRCVEVALAAFEALECRDYGRVDLRVDEAGACHVIDVNPNCDLHPQAGFAKAAALAGLDYSQLASHLVELALERRHAHQAPRGTRPLAALGVAGPRRELHTRRSALRARADRRRPAAGQP